LSRVKSLDGLRGCLYEIIERWHKIRTLLGGQMCANRVKLNKDKTQLLSKLRWNSVTLGGVRIQIAEWYTPKQGFLECCSIVRWPLHLMFDACPVSSKCFITCDRWRLSAKNLQKMRPRPWYVFVTRVDYCNSNLHLVSAVHVQPL